MVRQLCRWRKLRGRSVLKQRLTIPLSGGLATGTDGKQLPVGKSEELQNVRPGRIGEVVTRNGTSALGTGLLGVGGSLPAPWALGTLKGDLVSFSGVGNHPVNRYVPTSDSWATDNAGGFAAIQTKRRGPIAATLQQISGNGLFPDVVYSAGYYWVIYQTTRNGVASLVETVIDAATGEAVGEILLGGTFVSWGVRVVNGFAVFAYATATTIFIDTWPTASVGSGATNRVTISKTVANVSRQFDMLVKDATTISAAYSDGTNVQCFDYAPTAGAATFWTPKDSAAANIPTSYAVAWMQDFGGSGKIALIARAPAAGLRVFWDIPTAGATRQAVSTYVMDAAATSGALAGFTMTSAATGQFTVLYDDGTGSFALLRAATREAGVIATAIYYRSVQLGSKPFVGTDGKYYVGTEFYSRSQPTRFVARIPETITGFASLTAVVAKTQVNNGYTFAFPTGPLCPVSTVASGSYAYANTVQLRLKGNPTTYQPQGVGIDIVHVTFLAIPDTTTGAPREAIDSLFTPGGIVGQFDGRSYVDAGFNYYPEQPILTPGGGGALTSGATYYYVLVYSWVDVNGRTWYSAPSLVTSVAMGANNSNSVACPTYRLASRDDVLIEVYRGAANDNVTLAMVGSVVNDPTVDTVAFSDTFADSAVAAGQALYTNGAVGNHPLAADGIPGSSVVAIAAGRAWIISNDNPYEVWMSNLFIPGQGWRFSEQNKIILNDNLGPVTGVAQQPSGVVVIFKSAAYYLVSGNGPNQAGNGGSFSVSTPIVGAGTDNPRSILETPSGIEFRSGLGTRAWYRVNTANQTEYLGSPIERYTAGLPITGAVLISATGETRYYTSQSDSGRFTTLVHDPISDTWMVDVSPNDFGTQSAACAYGSGAAVAKSSTVYVEAGSTGADGASPFTVLTTTPWIKGSDLDGYVTFIRARAVGETAGGAPTVTVALQADFDTTTNLALQTAAPGAQWDWEIKYPAKLSAFRFVVSYVANAVPVKMSAIVVEYGVKQGMSPATWTKRTQ
jgi:hypothetical protein